MKKKLIISLLATASAIACAFGLAACGEKPHEHDYSSQVVAPTCTEGGYTVHTCACGDSYTDEETQPTGHRTKEWRILEEPTCTKNGKKEAFCSNCGLPVYESIEALGHVEEVIPAVEATCTSYGYTEGKKCSLCNEILVAPQQTPKLDHTPVPMADTDPTCGKQGHTGGTECKICGTEITEPDYIPATGNHTYEVETVNKLPTCTEQGYTTEKCTVCGQRRTTYQPAAHKLLADGSCSVCGKSSLEIEVVSVTEGNATSYYGVVKGLASGFSIKNIIIPDTYYYSLKGGNIPVTQIGANAFKGKIINSIKWGANITTIGDCAFKNCSFSSANDSNNYNGEYYSLTIPASVTQIGESAFQNAKTAGITFEEGSELTQIGNNSFKYCRGIETLKLGTEKTNLTIGDYAFAETDIALLEIHEKVDSIGKYAFSNCKQLVQVKLYTNGTTLNNIGDYAFSECNKLIEVYSRVGDLVEGSTDYGYLTYNAKHVVTGTTSPILYVNKTGDCLFYSNEVDTAYFMGYLGDGDTLVLPDKCGNLNYEIYPYALYNCSSLTSITIPESIISIPNYAFSGCMNISNIVYLGNVEGWLSISGLDNLMGIGFDASDKNLYIDGQDIKGELIIPNGITSIPDCAFYKCIALTSVIIPDSVTSIGERAFFGCSGLTSVSIPDSVTSIGDSAFYRCTELNYNEYDNAYYLGNETNPYVVLIKAKNTDITSCSINENTTIIGNDAFSNCSALTSLTIPNSVTSIGNVAFSNCSALTSLTIPNSVTSIGNGAFSNCRGLASVTIGNGVTNISSSAFNGCESITTATITTFSIEYIPKTNLQTVVITAGESIKHHAFFRCYSLINVTIENGIVNIGRGAFQECNSLANLIIGNSVTSIDDYAFYACNNLTSVIIPDSVTSIGNYSFEGCSSLTNISIPDSITFIGYVAFDNTNLDYIEYDNAYYLGNESNPYVVLIKAKNAMINNCTINENTKVIYSRAFIECNYLKSITITDGVKSIGNYAFSNCSALTSVTIPDSVQSIGNYAFSNCRVLASVTIGNGVTSIGSSAFYECKSLKEITFNGTMEEWQAMSKGSSWDNYTVTYTIICTDGTLDKDGNVIS